MYRYRSYCIQNTKSGTVHVRNSSGTFIQEFENDAEAIEFIDDLLDENAAKTDLPKDESEYYVYRIARLDQDTYSNYQYYNGKMFKYNAANIKYMSKSDAESVVKRYQRRDDYCNYYMKRKGSL